MTVRRSSACSVVLLLVVGCFRSHEIGGGDDGPGDCGPGCVPTRDGGPGPGPVCQPVVGRNLDLEPSSAVDLLFLIDDSGSMTEEQASVVEELPRLIGALASGRHPSGGGTFAPVESIRVGVISTDMGTGPEVSSFCTDFGDDGVLLTSGDPSDPTCSATYPSWLELGPDPDGLAQDASCVVNALGTSGCGFEQQLDAILKALAPSTSGITFAGRTVGHGDGHNAGFVREDALLAIVALTDEDDCSALDPALFDPTSTRYDPNLNLRCARHPEAVQPISRYVEGLLQLKPGRPDRVLFAPIVGIPVDLASASVDADAILADPRMAEREDPDNVGQLVPSCDVPGRGKSYPPRRFVRLAGELDARGAGAVVQSICQEDLGGVIDAIIDRIGAALTTTCLPAPYRRDGSGAIECELIELAEPGRRCDRLAGRTADGMDAATGRNRCRIRQVVARSRLPGRDPAGWFYDDFSDEALLGCSDTPQRIALTPGADPPSRSLLRLECAADATAGLGLGSPCDPRRPVCDPVPADLRLVFPEGLACDAETRTCQPRCADDLDCSGGFSCDLGTGFCRCE